MFFNRFTSFAVLVSADQVVVSRGCRLSSSRGCSPRLALECSTPSRAVCCVRCHRLHSHHGCYVCDSHGCSPQAYEGMVHPFVGFLHSVQWPIYIFRAAVGRPLCNSNPPSPGVRRGTSRGLFHLLFVSLTRPVHWGRRGRASRGGGVPFLFAAFRNLRCGAGSFLHNFHLLQSRVLESKGERNKTKNPESKVGDHLLPRPIHCRCRAPARLSFVLVPPFSPSEVRC